MAISTLDLYSYELAMNTQVSVILPERRGIPHIPHANPYPVLYLLHGHGQDHTSWIRSTRIEFYLQNSDIIVVMPNGNRGSYIDGLHTHHYGSYLTEELPLILKNWLHITSNREHTFIGGMSMGGYGALHAALNHSDRFCAVCSISAVINMRCLGSDKKLANALRIPNYPEIRQNLINSFGTSENQDDSAYDLKALARKANEYSGPTPRILQLCGSEDPLQSQNREFADFLKKECPNIEHVYKEYAGGHNFDFWDSSIMKMLQFFRLSA